MKLTIQQLRKIVDWRVHEALELRKLSQERLQEAAPPLAARPELGDSLDAQVDKKLIQYESISKSEKNEAIDLRALAYSILAEAGEDVEAGDKNAQQLSLNDIDVHEFAANVARLIDNAANLLEFKDTIIKRSINFLKKTYDATVVDQYVSVLDEEFDLVIGEDDVDKEFDVTPPPAVGAGVPPGA